jgi:hypothetical protein
MCFPHKAITNVLGLGMIILWRIRVQKMLGGPCDDTPVEERES